ncbi:protein-serine/threonine phosphatase [Ranunculus cassubicifolius]
MPSNLAKLNLAFRSGFRRPISAIQGGFKNSVGVLLGKGKLLFGECGSVVCESYSTLAEAQLVLRPATVLSARSESQVVNEQKSLSFAGAIVRTLSVPSVAGPPIQVCGYHIDNLLSDYLHISLDSPVQRLSVAHDSKVVFRDYCIDNLSLKNVYNSPSKATLTYQDKSSDSCNKVSDSLLNQGPYYNRLVNGHFLCELTKANFSSHPLGRSRGFHSSTSACYAAGTAPDVSLDGSTHEEQLPSSEVSPDQKTASDRSLKLLSGSCYLPHPDKEATGGEDAHFICVDEQAIGVADGVGGWADLGVDAGEYARELMSNSVNAIQEEPKGLIDPARVLEKAHSTTKARGSSTACIIALTEQGIHAINLGDSGFIIVRDGCTVFRSPVQQHSFNFTFQLESGNDGDLPSSGEVFNVPVVAGDVIIAGTDGLFDNLYNNEVTAVVVHAVRAGLAPQVTAQKIAALARQRALDSDRQTPFSTAAQDAGFRYYGGKLDDITVVVSYITSSSNV